MSHNSIQLNTNNIAVKFNHLPASVSPPQTHLGLLPGKLPKSDSLSLTESSRITDLCHRQMISGFPSSMNHAIRQCHLSPNLNIYHNNLIIKPSITMTYGAQRDSVAVRFVGAQHTSQRTGPDSFLDLDNKLVVCSELLGKETQQCKMIKQFESKSQPGVSAILHELDTFGGQ